MKVKPDLESIKNLGMEFDIERMQENAEQASRLLRALANTQRLRILCHLVGGELTVNQINKKVSLSQSALSQHLAILRRQRIVNTRRDAQTIYYTLAEGPARSMLETLHIIYCTNA